MHKFKRTESTRMKRNTLNKITVPFDNEAGKFVHQNL